ncbi:MAG: hypothetical protein P1P86_01090 [Bacteroidales bacterium]|nr:hypothetical protein [Bacteroidales bacterium]
MKKLFILSILFSPFLLSCDKEPEPEPEKIRSYCYLYHFVPELGSVIWEIDDIEVPEPKDYSVLLAGSVLLESASEEISFTVKHSGTKEVLVSQLVPMEQDKYYMIIVSGPADAPSLLIREIDTSRPQAGQVRFQAYHAANGQSSIDIYMGGSTPDKRVVSDLNLLSLSESFEVQDFDARAAITFTAHSEEYNQDSVILTSLYNDQIGSGASYLTVLAPFTFEPASELTIWLYSLPLE